MLDSAPPSRRINGLARERSANWHRIGTGRSGVQALRQERQLVCALVDALHQCLPILSGHIGRACPGPQLVVERRCEFERLADEVVGLDWSLHLGCPLSAASMIAAARSSGLN